MLPPLTQACFALGLGAWPFLVQPAARGVLQEPQVADAQTPEAEDAQDSEDQAPPKIAAGPWWESGNGWTFSNRGLEFKNPDRGLHLRVGGRIHLDSVFFNNDVTHFNNDTDFRRMRAYVSGRWGDFGGRLEKDFGGTVQTWKGVYARYYGIEHLRITLGNQIPPSSMEEKTSSNSLPLLERSLANSLSPGYLAGLGVSRRGSNWALGAGYYGNPLDGQPKRRSHGDGFNLRGTWAPVRSDEALVHVGTSLEVRDVDKFTAYRIRSRPESGLASGRLNLDTGKILDVEDTVTWGAESILRYSRLTLQGEYLVTHLNRQSRDVTFPAWSGRVGWLLRGGQRGYRVRSGALGSLVAPDALGALELSARISHLNLDDADITGGVATDYTVGLDWTLNRNLRILMESVLSRARPNRDGVNEQLRVYQMRLQVSL